MVLWTLFFISHDDDDDDDDDFNHGNRQHNKSEYDVGGSIYYVMRRGDEEMGRVTAHADTLIHIRIYVYISFFLLFFSA
jgi:hypothetical protein